MTMPLIGRPSRILFSPGEAGVGVEAREEEVDTEEREQDRAEPDDRHDGRLPAAPTDGQARVQQRRIEEPRDEGPRLLRVPAPIRPPGIFRPDRAGDDPQGQQREARGQAPVVDLVEDVQRRKALEDRPQSLPLDLLFLEQVHDPGAEGHGEYGVSDKEEHDVDREPVGVQRGSELCDLPRLKGREQAEYEGQRSDEGAQDAQAVAQLGDQEHRHDRQREERQRLEEVGDGGVARHEISRDEPDRVENDPDEKEHPAQLRAPLAERDDEIQVQEGADQVEEGRDLQQKNVHLAIVDQRDRQEQGQLRAAAPAIACYHWRVRDGPRISPAASFLAVLAIAIAGCAPELPIDEGTLVIAMSGAPTSVDPRLAADAYGEQILQLTHAFLIKRDPAGNPVPDLAERWEERSPTEIAFRLRGGARFHDGGEVTSRDVRYTFEWILDPKNRSPHRTTYSGISRIETPDPRTVVFHLKEPFAPFLVGMARGIVPAGS